MGLRNRPRRAGWMEVGYESQEKAVKVSVVTRCSSAFTEAGIDCEF